jgi:hypothetical protein
VRVVPTILDLDIGVVEHRAGYGYGYVFIPAQAPELHPFLVAGAIVDGTFVGSHLTIPTVPGRTRCLLTSLGFTHSSPQDARP